MEHKPKNREWVKTAAIIFLSVLLVLTFFSNTINNRLLPEVSTTAVSDGTITAKVRASGTVSAVGNTEIKASGSRTIASVKVKAGQEINSGDVLFVLGQAGDTEMDAAIDARDSAYFNYRRAQVSYPTDTTAAGYYSLLAAAQALDSADTAYYNACVALAQAGVADSDVQLALDKVNNAQAALQAATANADYNRTQALAVYEQAQADLDAFMLSTNPEDDPATYDALLNAVNTAQNNYLSLLDTSPEELNAINVLNNAETAYNILMSRYDSAYYTYQQAESALVTAQNAYNQALASYNSSVAAYNQSAAVSAVSAEEAQFNLDKQQAKVDALSGEGEDSNIYATVSGIVETINVSPGDTTAKGDILCVIEVPDMGYTMSSSVTVDQARRLKVGDPAQASNYYWGKTINATVSSIKTDPKDPQGKRIITFDIEGDVTSGQELTLSVGQKSASYDVVVPKSAVMSDNNGSFVLVIVSKSSPLGNRYYAKRVDVEILAEDDSARAVSGNLGNGDFVITNSSTKINAGDQIRLADAS